MSENKTYKRYDSASKYRQCGVRLAKDAESRDGEHGKMTRLTFTDDSRKEAHSTLWVEANVCDFQSELASFLLKGDILHLVEGKPCLRLYTDKEGVEKFSFVCDRAEIATGIELFNACKERGFVPGVKGGSKPAAKPAAKPVGKPAKAAVKPAAKKPAPIEISDDEDLEIDDADDE